MIRTSAIVAAAAVLLSLFLHFLGLTVTATDLTPEQAESGAGNAVELSSSFEEFAEPAPEPAEPETAETPEPPVEEAVEPDQAEVPITQALVASPNPEQVTSPDIGSPSEPQPEVSDPVETTGPEPVTEATPPVTPPVETAEAVEPASEPAEAESETAPEPVAPEPVELAALPPVETPAAPITPPELEAVEPEIQISPEETPDEEAEIDPDATEQAVETSKRPRLPNRRPETERTASLEGFRNFENLRNPQQTVESPLASYRKEGRDPFRVSSGQNQPDGRGNGNASTTNYAGQVLVHLNRAPVVFVSVRGFAQVFFQINADGTLDWVEVVDSSGSAELESAAREQVRRAAPFPPPPSGRSRRLSFYYQNG